MFISEIEAHRRLHSSENVLTVIDKDSSSRDGEIHTNEPPVIIPDEILPADDVECASASGIIIDESPTGKLLRKMIGLGYPGRHKGQSNMDPAMRAACSVTAELVNTRTAAQTFDTSYHHADELKHGYTSQQARYGTDEHGPEEPDKDLAKIINKQKKAVRDLAFEKLTKALGLMTDDKLLAVTDVVKLGRLSKDLSTVVDKVLPKDATVLGGVHFHVWRPEMKDESSYEQVSVGASGRP